MTEARIRICLTLGALLVGLALGELLLGDLFRYARSYDTARICAGFLGAALILAALLLPKSPSR